VLHKIGIKAANEAAKQQQNQLLAAQKNSNHGSPATSWADEDGTFIDRDGEYFRYILNYLRDGTLVVPPNYNMLSALITEANYYKLQGLVEVLSSKKSANSGKGGRLLQASHEGQADIEDAMEHVQCACHRNVGHRHSHGSLSQIVAPAEAKASEEGDEPVQAVKVTQITHACSRSTTNAYSWEEVVKHNTAESCWLVVSGKVFDVTTFLSLHPAGSKSILRHAGTEATRHFKFHSPNAQKKWKPYQIGVIEGHSKWTQCAIM
jgi:cytochrome b involved in lipid metabolism